jgi:hypothetical protein
MRPVLQTSLKAAIAAGVLQDPTVAGPLQRPEYVLEQETSAARLRVEAHDSQQIAKAPSKPAARMSS